MVVILATSRQRACLSLPVTPLHSGSRATKTLRGYPTAREKGKLADDRDPRVIEPSAFMLVPPQLLLTVLCSRQRQMPFPESGFLLPGGQSIRVRGGSYRRGDFEIEVISMLLPAHVNMRDSMDASTDIDRCFSNPTKEALKCGGGDLS